ncbi:MAG: hypothetical protein AB1412_05385 [Pseudomonadota bacterium]
MGALNNGDVSLLLGCSRTVASRLRAGQYDRPGSDLPRRYAALIAVVSRAQAAPDLAACAHAICVACPREDCTGCRIAEIV